MSVDGRHDITSRGERIWEEVQRRRQLQEERDPKPRRQRLFGKIVDEYEDQITKAVEALRPPDGHEYANGNAYIEPKYRDRFNRDDLEIVGLHPFNDSNAWAAEMQCLTPPGESVIRRLEFEGEKPLWKAMDGVTGADLAGETDIIGFSKDLAK